MSRCQKVQDRSSEFELGARLTSETSGEPGAGGENPWMHGGLKDGFSLVQAFRYEPGSFWRTQLRVTAPISIKL